MITAAHCFQSKGIQKLTQPHYLHALIGRFNLSDHDERGSIEVLVGQIVVHKDWKQDDEKYDADIAIVVLIDPVEFNNQIQPVCLPEFTYEDPPGLGTVAGWGKSNVVDEYSETPNKLKMPVINGSYCYTTKPELARYSSHRAFCAGFENTERGACSGDSGGGFFIEDSSSWKVFGIVSSSLANGKYFCNVDTFGIYTNVGIFRNWINDVIQGTKNTARKIVEAYCEASPVM